MLRVDGRKASEECLRRVLLDDQAGLRCSSTKCTNVLSTQQEYVGARRLRLDIERGRAFVQPFEEGAGAGSYNNANPLIAAPGCRQDGRCDAPLHALIDRKKLGMAKSLQVESQLLVQGEFLVLWRLAGIWLLIFLGVKPFNR